SGFDPGGVETTIAVDKSAMRSVSQGQTMPSITPYRLDIFEEAPDGEQVLRHRHIFPAADDAAAIKEANARYNEFAAIAEPIRMGLSSGDSCGYDRKADKKQH